MHLRILALTTSTLLGLFKNDPRTREEFLSLTRRK